MAGKKKRDFYYPSIENRALGAAFRHFRLARERSQEQLGGDARLERTYISLIERGQRSPTFSTICELCKGLNITLAELMARTQIYIDEFGAKGEESIIENSARPLPEDSIDPEKGV